MIRQLQAEAFEKYTASLQDKSLPHTSKPEGFIPFVNERNHLGQITYIRGKERKRINTTEVFDNLKKSKKEYDFERKFKKMRKALRQFERAQNEKEIDVDQLFNDCEKSLTVLTAIENRSDGLNLYTSLKKETDNKIKEFRKQIFRKADSVRCQTSFSPKHSSLFFDKDGDSNTTAHTKAVRASKKARQTAIESTRGLIQKTVKISSTVESHNKNLASTTDSFVCRHLSPSTPDYSASSTFTGPTSPISQTLTAEQEKKFFSLFNNGVLNSLQLTTNSAQKSFSQTTLKCRKQSSVGNTKLDVMPPHPTPASQQIIQGGNILMKNFTDIGRKYCHLVREPYQNPWKKWYVQETMEVFPGKIVTIKTNAKLARKSIE